ncbi:hypothetical protein ES703_20187 [subsurface metagenome]
MVKADRNSVGRIILEAVEETQKTVNKEDVSQAPSIALYQAMELARDRDSIARKRGMKKARQVSGWAGEVLSPGGVYTPEGKKKIEELDRSLEGGKCA